MRCLLGVLIAFIIVLSGSSVSKEEGISLPFYAVDVDVTAYTPSPDETDNDPRIMASGKRASDADLYGLRYVAVSRDLMEDYDVNFGDYVYIPFEVQDVMNPKWKRAIDIFMPNKHFALQFGRRRIKIIILKVALE